MKNLKLIGVLFLVTTLITFGAFIGVAKTEGEGELVWVSYGGGRYGQSQNLAYFEPFQTDTGIKTIETAWGAEYSKLKAMVESGNVKWDIVEVTPSVLIRGVKEGLFTKLDYDKIDVKKSEVIEGSLRDYGIATIIWPTMLMYNTDVYGEGRTPPSSWEDFWDTNKYPGPRTLQDTPRGNLEFALLADGVPRDELYPLDVERAFDKLDEIKDEVKVWWSKGAQPPQLVSNKEANMGSVWIGRWWTAMREGQPVNATFNQGALEIDYWAIPNGAPNKENALKFLKWYLNHPMNQAWHAKDFNCGVPLKAANKYLTQEELSHLPTSGSNIDKEFRLNSEWWAENLEEIVEKWQMWKLS